MNPNSHGSVRIMLADDHAILRAGLRLLLENQPNFTVVGEAENGVEALALVGSAQPDVLLLDLNMPEADGISVLAKIRQTAPKTKVLVLTMHDDARYLKEALAAGAAGYVLKKAVDTELLIAIRAVLRGEVYIHSAMTQKLLTQVDAAAGETADPWKTLSEREYDVLKRIALGYTNAEIGEELFLSTKTVETYRARGMEKLDLQSRAQLVKSALRFGHLD